MSSRATALRRIIRSIGQRSCLGIERPPYAVRSLPKRHASSSPVVSRDRLALELLKALRVQLTDTSEPPPQPRAHDDSDKKREQGEELKEDEIDSDLNLLSDASSIWAARAEKVATGSRKTGQAGAPTLSAIFEDDRKTFTVQPQAEVRQETAIEHSQAREHTAVPMQPTEAPAKHPSAAPTSPGTKNNRRMELLPPALPTTPEVIASEEQCRRRLDDVPLQDLPSRIEVSQETAARLYTDQIEAIHTSRAKALDAESLKSLWQHSVSLVISMTSKEPEAYKEATQILRPAEGWLFALTEEPNDIILRVFEHTGCSMQMELHAQGDGKCSAFSLTGTRSQVSDTLTLLEEWGAIRLVSATAAKTLLSPDGMAAETVDLAPGLIRRTLPRGPPWVEEEQLKTFIEGARDRITLPPMLLSAAVEALITSQAWLPDSSVEGTQSTIVADAITTLLCEASNVPSTSTATLQSAFSLLSKQKLYKHVQTIQDAHDRKAGFRVLSTAPCNVLLQDAVLHQDMRAFRSILRYMSKRSMFADPETWSHLLRITESLLPDQLDMVKNSVLEHGMMHTEPVRLCLLQTQLVPQLQQKIESVTGELPSTLVKDFVADLTSIYGPRWLRRDMACKLLDFLLPRGYWREAFEVCEAMLKQGHAMKLRVLSRFLRGAGLDKYRGVDRIVQVLDRFDAFLRPRGTKRPAGGVQTKHLVKLTVNEYDIIFKIARTNKSWNVLRAVWQHACCHGAVSTDMRLRMLQSLQHRDLPYALHVLGVGEHEARPRDPKTAKVDWKRDEAAYGQVVPVNSLAKDVRAGRAFDLDWKRQPKRNSTRVWPSAQSSGKQPRITVPVKAAMKIPRLEDSRHSAL